MVEFVFAGIAAAVMMICCVQISYSMWNYHTLAYAVHEANRYIASHGRDCSLGGNACTITVANIVSKLEASGIGLTPANLNLTLTSASGTVKSCAPVTNCTSDSTQWPPVANLDNDPPNLTTVLASYTYNSAFVGLWYGTSGRRIGSITMTSQSQIPMLF